MLLNLRLELFVVLTNSIHEILKELMSRRPILVGIHHLNQGFFILVFLQELNPPRLMVDLPCFHPL